MSRLEQPDAVAQLSTSRDDDRKSTAPRSDQAAVRSRLDSLAAMFAAGEIDARQLATATTTLRET